jgi:ParB family chromosome partitioning protein
MRHDYHYVESITALTGAAIGKMISLERIRPNPNQPRKEIGSLRELTHSIREKGVLEPLLVRYDAEEDMYTIISGERRYHASKAAGLMEVPCIERDADSAEMLELALIENLQRKDLHPFEEAEGLKALADQFDYTHEEIARRIGKSRATVSEVMALLAIPAAVRTKCGEESEKKMASLAEKLAQGMMTREEARAERKQKAAPRLKPFLYSYRAPDGEFELRLKFRKAVVLRREILETLQAILQAVKRQKD